MTLEDLEKKLAALRAIRDAAESQAIACTLIGDIPAAQAHAREVNAIQPEIHRIYTKIRSRLS
jgi:hypothetical protein